MLYIRYLVEQKRQTSTIHSYISALKEVLKDNKIKVNEDQYLLMSLTKACHLKNDRVKNQTSNPKIIIGILAPTIGQIV